MDAKKSQNLQKAQEGVELARKFVEAMEINSKKDLVKDSALKSGDNEEFAVLPQEDVETQDEDLKLFGKLLDKNLVKAKDLDSQEANLAREMAAVQEKKSKQKAEIKALHGKLVEKISSIIGDTDLETSQQNEKLLEQKLADSLKLISEQNSKIAEQDNQIGDLNSKVLSMYNDLAKKESLFGEFRTKIIKLIAHQKTEIEEFKQKNLTLQETTETIQQRFLDAQKLANGQKAKIDDLNQKIQNLTTNLVKKDKLVVDLKSTQNQQKFEIESLKQQKQTVEKSLENIQNCFPRLQKFLKEPVDAKDDTGYTKLHIATRDRNVEDVETLLMLGADVNAKNKNQITPLHFAADKGYLEIVKLLLQNGADVNAKNNNQYTPLHHAADKGHSKIAELLIQSGADVHAKSSYQSTPLHYAARNGYLEVVEVLLNHGARKDLKGYWNRTPLQEAENYKRGEFTKVIAFLKQN